MFSNLIRSAALVSTLVLTAGAVSVAAVVKAPTQLSQKAIQPHGFDAKRAAHNMANAKHAFAKTHKFSDTKLARKGHKFGNTAANKRIK